MIKVLFVSDLHACTDTGKQEKLINALEQIYMYCSTERVDYIVIPGDIWETRQSFQGGTGVEIVFDYLRKLSKKVKYILITKGNNHHDAPGSISPIHLLKPNILAYEYPVIIGINDVTFTDILRSPAENDYKAIFTLVPYPTIENLVTTNEINHAKQEFDEIFSGFMDLLAIKTEEYHCPKIFAMHGNVLGSKFSNGQPIISRDPILNPFVIDKANHDFYCFGHIHKRQIIRENMIYPGSPYHKDFGEIEEKSFTVVTFNDGGYEVKVVPLNTRPMAKISATFENGRFSITDIEEVPINAEVQIKFNIADNEIKLLNDEAIEELKKMLKTDSITLKKNVIPTEKQSRSEEIMNLPTLADEVKEWGQIMAVGITEEIINKVYQVEELLQVGI